MLASILLFLITFIISFCYGILGFSFFIPPNEEAKYRNEGILYQIYKYYNKKFWIILGVSFSIGITCGLSLYFGVDYKNKL